MSVPDPVAVSRGGDARPPSLPAVGDVPPGERAGVVRAGEEAGLERSGEPRDTAVTGRTARPRRRWRWPAAALGLLLLVVLAALLPEPPRSTVPLAPDNPDDAGAQAVARILEREGVDVDYVRTTAAAVDAATDDRTLMVTSSGLLAPTQVEALAATGADLVLLDPGVELLSAVTGAGDHAGTAGEPTERTARCDDPDAQAAGTVTTGSAGYRALTDAATVCFPGDGSGSGALLVVDGDRRVTALADPSLLTNARLAEDGHAALTLRLLGRHDQLVWYVPSIDDLGTTEPAGPGLGELLPPWAGPVAVQALLVALVAALWRGRRLGRLVTEPLPVTVAAAETTRGRGRLYRRSRAYGHAAAALRAGAASRSAARLGLPRSAGAVAVIEALAGATGRSTDDVAALLYGPPPTDDAGLTGLARRLDDLESEVHRP